MMIPAGFCTSSSYSRRMSSRKEMISSSTRHPYTTYSLACMLGTARKEPYSTISSRSSTMSLIRRNLHSTRRITNHPSSALSLVPLDSTIITTTGTTIPSSSITYDYPSSSSIDNVFSTEDIVIGIIIAISLALIVSFLQNRRNQNDFILSTSSTLSSSIEEVDDDDYDDHMYDEEEEEVEATTTTMKKNQNQTSNTKAKNNKKKKKMKNVFSKEDWKSVSTQPETYILYRTRIRQRQQRGQQQKMKKSSLINNNGNNDNDMNDKSVNTMNSTTLMGQAETETTTKQTETKDAATTSMISLIVLLIVFIPIFSIEFFFALSRQIICDTGISSSSSSVIIPIPSSSLSFINEWSQYLCSPV